MHLDRGDKLARIPYVDNAIIPRALGQRGNINLLRILYQSPTIGEAVARLVAAELTGLALPPKYRELLILHTAWHTQSEYAWTPHQEIARSVGVSDAQIASIQQGQIQSFAFSVREKKLLQFVSRIAASQTLSDDDFEEAREHFSDRELLEIVAVQGFYYIVAMIASVFELEIDSSWNASIDQLQF
jgi:4-carboxymuconolactone decarboxylase